jgi:hypothetical protein
VPGGQIGHLLADHGRRRSSGTTNRPLPGSVSIRPSSRRIAIAASTVRVLTQIEAYRKGTRDRLVRRTPAGLSAAIDRAEASWSWSTWAV